MKSIVAATVLAVILTSTSTAQNDPGLKLVGHPAIIIDSLCNPEGSGTLKAKIKNGTAAPVHLALGATLISSKSPARQSTARLTAIPIEGTESDEADPTDIPAGGERWVKLDVQGLYDKGDWESTLQNENVDIGSIAIVRQEAPFLASLDVPAPSAPELTFNRKQPGYFTLKNDGAEELRITWEYLVEGQSIQYSDPIRKGRHICRENMERPDHSGIVVIPANSSQQILLSPRCDWFGSRFSGLFKEKVADGLLSLHRVKSNCAGGMGISKSYKVKTHLISGTGLFHDLSADLVLLLILAAGGICSLALNAALPNQMKKLKLKSRLGTVMRQITDLSTDLASRLRVMVGMEAGCISERLRNLTWINSDFPAEMQSADQAVTKLETRIHLLDQLGSLRSDFQMLRSHRLPPTIISELEDTFTKLVAIGAKSEPSDADIKNAQDLIKKIEDQLGGVNDENPVFVAKLSGRIDSLRKDFGLQGAVGKTQTCADIRKEFPRPFDELSAADPKALSPAQYVNIDEALRKLDIIRDYVALIEGLDANDPLRAQRLIYKPALMDSLKKTGWEALNEANLLVGRVSEGKFKHDIELAIQDHKVRIKRDRFQIRPFEACEFRLEFTDPCLNRSAARQEWVYKWEFCLEAEQQTLSEEGAAVTHYFQKPTTYLLKVTLIHSDGTTLGIEDQDNAIVNVLPPKGAPPTTPGASRFSFKAAWQWLSNRWIRLFGGTRKLDIIRLCLALFIALIGLLAGAKDQLLKLDIAPAIIAIFLVGFGADQIKNVLTQKNP